MNKIKWCFSLKKGLKDVGPNKEIANSYLIQAENTLSKIKTLIDEGDFVWASVRIYYCAYYSIYAFLQRIGIKSENHDCSIELVKKLIDKKFIDNIEDFKENRVNAQYYLKTGQKDKLLKLYLDVKNFYFDFKEIIENLSEEDVKEYINKTRGMLNE